MYATTRDFRTFSAPQGLERPGLLGHRLDRHQARRRLLPLHQGRAQQHVLDAVLEVHPRGEGDLAARPRLGLRQADCVGKADADGPGVAGRGPDGLQVQHRGQVVPADRRVRRPRLRAVRDHRPGLRQVRTCRPAGSSRRARATAPSCRSPRPSWRAAQRTRARAGDAGGQGARLHNGSATDTTGHGYNGTLSR